MSDDAKEDLGRPPPRWLLKAPYQRRTERDIPVFRCEPR